MKRCLMTGITAMSAAVGLLLLAIWGVSAWRSDAVVYDGSGGAAYVLITRPHRLELRWGELSLRGAFGLGSPDSFAGLHDGWNVLPPRLRRPDTPEIDMMIPGAYPLRGDDLTFSHGLLTELVLERADRLGFGREWAVKTSMPLSASTPMSVAANRTTRRLSAVTVPIPAVAALAFVLPAGVATRRLRGRRRRLAGRCVACGYDLRGSPPGGRCPECGRAGHIAPPAPAGV